MAEAHPLRPVDPETVPQLLREVQNDVLVGHGTQGSYQYGTQTDGHPGYFGTQRRWVDEEVDLAQLVGQPEVRLRFRLTSDVPRAKARFPSRGGRVNVRLAARPLVDRELVQFYLMAILSAFLYVPRSMDAEQAERRLTVTTKTRDIQ